MTILEGGRIESCFLSDSHSHFQSILNSILSVLAGNFNLISRDIILQSYWLMFLHRRFIFTDKTYVLGFKFTGAVQSLLSSDDHLKGPYLKMSREID